MVELNRAKRLSGQEGAEGIEKMVGSSGSGRWNRSHCHCNESDV